MLLDKIPVTLLWLCESVLLILLSDRSLHRKSLPDFFHKIVYLRDILPLSARCGLMHGDISFLEDIGLVMIQ